MLTSLARYHPAGARLCEKRRILDRSSPTPQVHAFHSNISNDVGQLHRDSECGRCKLLPSKVRLVSHYMLVLDTASLCPRTGPLATISIIDRLPKLPCGNVSISPDDNRASSRVRQTQSL